MREKLVQLNPAYFSLVMATGILGLATHLLKLPALAMVLFWLNVCFFVVLTLLNAARVVCCAHAVWENLTSHEQAFGFFTAPAASCILGSQVAKLFHDQMTATALWIAAIILWVPLTYTVFAALIVRREKPSLESGIHGGWLLAVVATQSIANLGAVLAREWVDSRGPATFFATTMWLGGGMLYLWIIPVLFYRYVFFRVRPGDLQPVFWINMGAMSISALAGSNLAGEAADASLVRGVAQVIQGATLLYWAAATWWIPMLVVLGIWRHVCERFPLRYNPLYWGMVFPLGMYTVATHEVAKTFSIDWLRPVPGIFIYVPLSVWTVVFVGMVYSFGHQLVSGAEHSSPPA